MEIARTELRHRCQNEFAGACARRDRKCNDASQNRSVEGGQLCVQVICKLIGLWELRAVPAWMPACESAPAMCTALCRVEESLVAKGAALRPSGAAGAGRSRCVGGRAALGPRLVEKRDLLSSARGGDREALATLLLPYATGLYL